MTTTSTHSTYSRPDQASPDSGQARHYHACLVMHDGKRFCALTDEGTVWVAVAAGCLLQPCVGDTVLVSVSGAGGYILTVLERGRPDQAAVLAAQGVLRVEADAVEIAAGRSLTLDAGLGLNVRGTAARVQLDTARVDCKVLGIEGGTLQSTWARRSDIAQERITVAARSEAHFGYSTRRIAGHEEMTAASFRQSVARDWSVHAATAELVGNDRVVVDSHSVQLG